MSRPNYSENWFHLKTLLNGLIRENRMDDRNSYEDHVHAKAISVFLANATLATPKLDRATVEQVLSGTFEWPHELGTNDFQSGSVKLSFLEENGFVSFYADWLSIHSNSVRDRSDIDPSINILLDAVEHLKNIKYGWNNFIRPYYKCEEQKLKDSLQAEFGHSNVYKLIPELVIKDNHYELKPNNQSFDSLVSKYLWQLLNESLDTKDAFSNWMLLLRVNCDWCNPIYFSDHEHVERVKFNNALLEFLANDLELNHDVLRLGKQNINDNSFSLLVTQNKVTIDELPTAYRQQDLDPDSNNFQFVHAWKKAMPWSRHEVFYSGLINNAIKSNVRIEEQSLSAQDFVENILELAKQRPVLRHLIFNVLNEFQNYEFKLLLLSRPDTCDVGLYYLTRESFSRAFRRSHSFTQPIDSTFQLLVCDEYLKAIESEPNCGERIFNILEYMGEQCNFQNNNYSSGYEYKFLICLLNLLNTTLLKSVSEAFVRAYSQIDLPKSDSFSKSHLYLIGFRLIDRLDQFGIDSETMKSTLLNFYTNELNLGIDGLITFYPNDFISSLPWHQLINESNYSKILKTSSSLGSLKAKLVHSKNSKNFTSASALKSHLLVLMVIGRLHQNPKVLNRIKQRILDYVKVLGFGSNDEAAFIFNEMIYSEKLDVWPQFCSYTNLFDDDQFEDFIECCLDLIPPNQRFVLYERCNKASRSQILKDNIASLNPHDHEEMGIKGIEQAFISASNSNQDHVATDLLNAAKKFLKQDRFKGSTNSHFLELQNTWLKYEYRWQLIQLLNKHKDDAEAFRAEAISLDEPEFLGNPAMHRNKFKTELESFRRYIIAAAFVESNPEKSIAILEVLCAEIQADEFIFMLFNARRTYYSKDDDFIGLRGALSKFLADIQTEPKDMATTWVQMTLDTFRQINDKTGLDVFWNKLSLDQKSIKDILIPYCKAQIELGDHLLAQQVFERYKQLNPDALQDLEIDNLNLGVVKADFKAATNSYITANNEPKQATIAQLSQHYKDILSRDFIEYVQIVRPGCSPHEYLKHHIEMIMRELLMRKKNLQLHSTKPENQDNYKITEEDLINDWFTSLFDSRMSHAQIGFRDQKRSGSSSSGKRPGESDGFITAAGNDRLAIYEAFRLFSMNTTVINEHLNKIARYDEECLSTVFIVAYCDVDDFKTLVNSYKAHIPTISYTGFLAQPSPRTDLTTLHNKRSFWLGREIRFINSEEVVFYHLMLNFKIEVDQ